MDGIPISDIIYDPIEEKIDEIKRPGKPKHDQTN